MQTKRNMLKSEKNIGFLLYINKVIMIWKGLLILCIGFVLFIGCGNSSPNLDDPEVREKILSKAMNEDDLQTRRARTNEFLIYAPNQEKPYTGWVKGTLTELSETMEWNNIQKIEWSIQFVKPRLIEDGFITGSTDEQTDEWEDIRTLQWIENGRKHGPYISWYSNSRNSEKGAFFNDMPIGLWSYYYENGQKFGEGNFKEKDEYKIGVRDGIWIFWHRNGQKGAEGNYFEGTYDGKWTQWYENGQMRSIQFYKNGKEDGVWLQWNKNGQRESIKLKRKLEKNRNVEKNGNVEEFGESFGLSISPDFQNLASAGSDNTIEIWNMNTGEHEKTLIGHEHTVSQVNFSPNGEFLVSRSSYKVIEDNNSERFYAPIRVWNVKTGNNIISTDFGETSAIAFSPDGKTLAIAKPAVTTTDKVIIRLYNLNSGKELKSLTWDVPAWQLTFSYDLQIIGATVSVRGVGTTIQLLDVNTGKHLKTIAQNTEINRYRFSIHGIPFSPNGKILALSRLTNNAHYIELLNINSGEIILTSIGVVSLTSTYAFSPDSKTFAIGDYGRIQMWDVITGKIIKTVEKFGRENKGIMFSPNGKLIARIFDNSIDFLSF